MVVAALTNAPAAFIEPMRPTTGAGRQLPVRAPSANHRPAPPRVLRRASASLDEALSLPPSNVVDAVSRTGTRVTAADVAATGGMAVEEAKKGMLKLAAVLGAEASLDVSSSGEIIYNFPPDVQGALTKASSAAATRQAWEKAKPVLFTGLRIGFGVGLFASIAIIYSALIVLSQSGNDRRDNRSSDRFEGGGGFGFGPTLWYGPSPFDLFFYRPYYSYGGYEYAEEEKPKMGFLEAVYSFVFGDGDPNNGREKEVLAAVAASARRYNGVLTAEQLAPLLTPPAYKSSEETINVDEGWVLEAVTRLNGRPEVTEAGEIVYVFDDLQTTAGQVRSSSRPPSLIEEKEIPFSLADEGQLLLAGLLGAANLIGAGYLGLKLASLPAGLIFPGFLGTVQTIFPGLLAYAIGFMAAPVVRWFRLGSRNREIQGRNESRRQWLGILKSGKVDGKLAQARNFATSMRQVGSGDSVYSTAKAAADQDTRESDSMADFDRKLGLS